jgi:hypothetical protein
MRHTVVLIALMASSFLISCNRGDQPSSTASAEIEQQEDQEPNRAADSAMDPLALGEKIALQTQGVLGKNLMQAINSKGTEHALSFCSERAIALTDSMGLALNAQVKRVSDKNRNPDNEANATELAYIHAAQEALAKGQTILPQLQTTEDSFIGYYPIVTNGMCLQCHGQPEKDIALSTLTKINELYPFDKAVGYQAGELRGIWVIEMDRE